VPVSGEPALRPSVAEGYAACERMARRHYENFPVASRLLSRAMRPHIAAVYAFARVADDFADESGRPAEQRQHLLDQWLDRLRDAVERHPAGTIVRADAAADGRLAQPDYDQSAMFAAMANTVHECRLPLSLFEDLISAFRQDTTVKRYETFGDVLDYCRRSADPVGRLVLAIAGYRDERVERASDKVCTALQLANFWQDLEQDWQRGRLYVPQDMMRASGAKEEDLAGRRLTSEWREVMSELTRRTRQLFLQGREAADLVRGRLRLELRLTWLGGWRILERLEKQRFDVFAGGRPTLGARDVPLLLWRAATWRVSRPRAAFSGLQSQGPPAKRQQAPEPPDRTTR
jgi:squalene synthase HpnC